MVLIKWTPARALSFSRFKDSYQAHRTLCNYLDCPGSDFLSVEKDGSYYTLSEKGPSGTVAECLSQVVELPGDYLLEGATYKFDLKVNATKKIKGKRVPLVGATQLTEWLLNREESWGVDIQDLNQVSSLPRETFRGGGNRITVAGTTVQGALVIKDVEKFTEVFKNGVGKSKSFGYGMFQLIKILS